MVGGGGKQEGRGGGGGEGKLEQLYRIRCCYRGMYKINRVTRTGGLGDALITENQRLYEKERERENNPKNVNFSVK